MIYIYIYINIYPTEIGGDVDKFCTILYDLAQEIS